MREDGVVIMQAVILAGGYGTRVSLIRELYRHIVPNCEKTVFPSILQSNVQIYFV